MEVFAPGFRWLPVSRIAWPAFALAAACVSGVRKTAREAEQAGAGVVAPRHRRTGATGTFSATDLKEFAKTTAKLSLTTGPAKDVVLYFDMQQKTGPWSILRPADGGEIIANGTAPADTLYGLTHYHREYLAITDGLGNKQIATPIFARKGTGDICGVGLFSQSARVCKEFRTKAKDAPHRINAESLALAMSSDRAFGVEYEFVAQDIPGLSSEQNPHILMAGLENCMRSASSGMPDAERLGRWNWEPDDSVEPLLKAMAARMDGVSAEAESHGSPFEVTSPLPPHAPSGDRGLLESLDMLSLLKHMGIQAPPSASLHVHINVASPQAPGKMLTFMQIANVWLSYVKYQFAIDEMLSPARVGNPYAQRLFFGNCPILGRNTDCDDDPCGCLRRFFVQMHAWFTRQHKGGPAEFCDFVLDTPSSVTRHPCREQRPDERYYQLNLAPLGRFGTIEFRAHSATYDVERAGRWINFLVGFVDHFSVHGGMDAYLEGSADAQYEEVMRLQRHASAANMWSELSKHGKISPSSRSFYVNRTWEQSDTHCFPNVKASYKAPDVPVKEGR